VCVSARRATVAVGNGSVEGLAPGSCHMQLCITPLAPRPPPLTTHALAGLYLCTLEEEETEGQGSRVEHRDCGCDQRLGGKWRRGGGGEAVS
jgi:hypothetical protein